MAQLELSGRRAMTGRRTTVAVAALAVLAGIWAGYGAGYWTTGSTESFDATVVTISSDGDSLCLDREDDSCGLPIILPEDRERVMPGSRVTVTELGLETGDDTTLAFFVRPKS
jgi:hypothetical protein